MVVELVRDVWEGLADPVRRNAATRTLISQLGAQLYARIRAIVGEQEADDVFQNVLIKIVQGAEKFDGRSAFSTWCYRIATNESLDTLRSRRRRIVSDVLPEGFADRYRADQELPGEGTLERLVIEAMASLPQQQRQVFEERYFHETPYAEMARREGKSEGALKANFHHAVRKVSEYLRAHMPITSL